jgi:serine/threonine protein kinase
MKMLGDGALESLRREAALPPLEGTRYTLVRAIGAGGMGEVYLVEDGALDRLVAMKVLTGIEPSPELAARMLREARIVARLEHPGIVPVHDVGHLSDGRPFFTMKFVQGERLDRCAAMALADRLRALHKVCEAVAFAHAHGVLHRDLKPENIMIGTFGEVLVMDWGIAKAIREHTGMSRLHDGGDVAERATGNDAGAMRHAHSSVETGKGAVLGTPSYMAPEQALGAATLDERADLYGLCAILYFMLTGAPPRCDRSHDEAPRSPRAIDSTIPRPLDAICMKGLALLPEERYAGARELADDIVRWLDGGPVTAYRENVLERAWRWIARNRFVLLLILAYLVMRVALLLATGH